MSDGQQGVAYLDTSAVVKLVVAEAESQALEQELANLGDFVTSEITQIELGRAVARARTDPDAAVADDFTILGVIASIAVIYLNDDIRASAASMPPVELRTLDAIHLASALAVREHVATVVTYDHRFQQAAIARGLKVTAPGSEWRVSLVSGRLVVRGT